MADSTIVMESKILSKWIKNLVQLLNKDKRGLSVEVFNALEIIEGCNRAIYTNYIMNHKEEW